MVLALIGKTWEKYLSSFTGQKEPQNKPTRGLALGYSFPARSFNGIMELYQLKVKKKTVRFLHLHYQRHLKTKIKVDKPVNILIVDDDPDLGIMLKTMLEYKGYGVTVSKRAEQAEEILRGSNAELIILDMLLSGVNGIDVCTRLKQDSRTSHIPVLMISAHPNGKEICLEAGANDFISKPFEMQDLFSKVTDLINKE